MKSYKSYLERNYLLHLCSYFRMGERFSHHLCAWSTAAVNAGLNRKRWRDVTMATLCWCRQKPENSPEHDDLVAHNCFAVGLLSEMEKLRWAHVKRERMIILLKKRLRGGGDLWVVRVCVLGMIQSWEEEQPFSFSFHSYLLLCRNLKGFLSSFNQACLSTPHRPWNECSFHHLCTSPLLLLLNLILQKGNNDGLKIIIIICTYASRMSCVAVKCSFLSNSWFYMI